MDHDNRVSYSIVIIELKSDRCEFVHAGSGMANVQRHVVEQQKFVANVCQVAEKVPEARVLVRN